MKIHEYQAKQIFADYGIIIPPGKVVTNPADAELAAAELGSQVMIKAQIYAGGRGKAGGIKPADSPAAARKAAEEILGNRLKTAQTSTDGILVKQVLVEKRLSAKQEFYLGITADRKKACPVLIASSAGGMGIEEVARAHPEKIVQEAIDPVVGLRDFQIRHLVYRLGLGKEITIWFKIIQAVYKIFVEKDCSLIEINPLILTDNNILVALDAKIVFDDNALFRHPEIKALADIAVEDPLEMEAKKRGINYLRLNGNIGCLVHGAGLSMATMDTIHQLGGEPANFLDLSGSARAEEIEIAFLLLLNDPNVKAILITIFNDVTPPEYLVKGLTDAIAKKELKVPVVIRMIGADTTDGIAKLTKSGFKFIEAKDMEDGVQKVVNLVKGGAK